MGKKKARFLDQLLHLVAVLNRKEIDVAKKHIIAYETNLTVNERKMFQLLTMCISLNVKDFDNIKLKVSPESSEASFNRLIKRTTNRIQESLTIDVNIKRKGAYSDIFRERFHLRKKLMEAYILQGKGLSKRSLSIYNQIIKNAKIYELYDECIEALSLKQSLTSGIRGLDNHELLTKEISAYHQKRDALNQVRSLHRKYYSEVIKIKDIKQKNTFLKNAIELGNLLFDQHLSKNLLSQVLILEMEYHFNTGKVKKELKAGNKLLELLKRSKSVFSRPRIAFVNSSLANSVFVTCNFKLAYQYSEESIAWSKESLNINQVVAKIQQIKCLIFNQESTKSLELIEELKRWQIIKNYPNYETQLTYFKMVNLFMLNDFSKASKELNYLREIEKDREGWNVWIRILKIMISIEKNQISTIDYDVDNLRKYIARIRTPKQKRLKLILNVFVRLLLNGLDFTKEDTKLNGFLSQLKLTEEQLKWDPNTPEMILFHDWFESKKEMQPYTPHFEPYRSKA